MTTKPQSAAPGSAGNDYALGYGEDIVQKINQRSVGREGSFVLPSLRQGMSLLDAGCGPGSITLGLARLLAPGAVTGIDIDAGQVAQAQGSAREMGIENARFQVADVYHLPFEDQSFDAVFCHTVFRHLADPGGAMVELFRVCKPGGVIGVRDGLGMFDHLASIRIGGAPMPFSEIVSAVSAVGPGMPDIGVRLKGLLRAAGFGRIKPTTYNEVYHEPVDLMMVEGWFRSILNGTLGQRAVEAGVVSRAELTELLAKMQGWPGDPDAISIVSWIEYLAWKP